MGAGHTLSRLCLSSRDSPIALPIDSLEDTWKVEKCRLQQSYKYSPDEFIRSVAPKVRSGKVWNAEKVLEEAERERPGLLINTGDGSARKQSRYRVW